MDIGFPFERMHTHFQTTRAREATARSERGSVATRSNAGSINNTEERRKSPSFPCPAQVRGFFAVIAGHTTLYMKYVSTLLCLSLLLFSRRELDTFSLPVAVVNMDSDLVASHAFLASLPNDRLTQKSCSNMSEAVNSYVRKEAWGILELGSNFSKTLRCSVLLETETQSRNIDALLIDVEVYSIRREIVSMLRSSVSYSIIVSVIHRL